MTLPKKAVALAGGLAFVVLSMTATNLVAAPGGEIEMLDLPELATLDWIERANVAAFREGIVEKMELQIGMPVAKGRPIGYLHSEMAELTVRKAELAARSQGPLAKANASRELAISVVARNKRLNDRIPGSVSPEEAAKADAELKVAEAAILESKEKIELDRAELDLAKRVLEEHTIVAPFDGIVMDRIKNPGDSVRANESVVKLGNLTKLRAFAYVPLEYASRVKEGQIVEIQPRLSGNKQKPQPIESKRFRGKITFVDPTVQAVAETAVRIYAEFDNKDLELRPGYKANLTIFLNSETNAAVPATATRTASGVGR